MISDKGREKLSNLLKGNKRGLGHTLSDEAKRKIGIAHTKYEKIEGKKFCPDCNKHKDISEFHKMSSHSDGLHVICKTCSSVRHKEYYEKNKEKLKANVRENNKKPHVIANKRNRNLQTNYGITEDKYQEMLSNQNGCCAICQVEQSELSYRLYVDHDHTTGEVRGLLCKHCNSGIGLFKDNKNILSKAIDYLRGK